MKQTIEQVANNRWVAKCNDSKVRIRQVVQGRYTRYRIEWRLGKEKKSQAISNKEKALNTALEKACAIANGRGDLTYVDPETFAYWRLCINRLNGTPLHDAVNFFLKYNQKSCITTSEAIAGHKINIQNRSKRYRATTKYVLKYFELAFGERQLCTIQPEEIETYLAKPNWSPTTRDNHLRVIKIFFNYAKKKRILPKGYDSLDSFSKAETRIKTPCIVTPDELRLILQNASEKEIPLLTIVAFGGGRNAEVSRLNFENIDFEEGIIKLDSEITKTNQRRTLEITPNLHAWLAPFKEHQGPINKISAPLKRLRENLKGTFVWRQNGLRHSFISYHLALHRNAAQTAELAGNSVEIIKRHYKALVSRAQAEQWFSIFPQQKQRDLP